MDLGNNALLYMNKIFANKEVPDKGRRQFLSDPGPIIVYACQALTDSLTDWRPFETDVTTLLKMEWIDLNMQTI